MQLKKESQLLSQLPTSYVMKSVSISNAFRKFLDSLSVCLLHNNFDKSVNSSFKVVLTEISFPKRDDSIYCWEIHMKIFFRDFKLIRISLWDLTTE